MTTFSGAVDCWTPIVAGARGRARCRKFSGLTAMLGRCMKSSWLEVGFLQSYPLNGFRVVGSKFKLGCVADKVNAKITVDIVPDFLFLKAL